MSAKNSMAIQTRGLSRSFGSTLALADLSISVSRGEVFGLLGHNGAGKTTTIRLLNGVVEPTSGTSRVLGLDPVSQGPELRERSGVLTETPALDERITARETLLWQAEIFNMPARDIPDRISRLLDTFQLSDRGDDRIGSFSRGMKGRLALARALLHDPEILFLDEPTTGLDPVATRTVHGIIEHLSKNEGRTVFLCTHNMMEASRLCHRVAVVDHGHLVALGTPGELSRRLIQDISVRLEVDPQDVDTATEILADHKPRIESPSGMISISAGNKDDIPTVLGILSTAGISVYRVEPREPTLEDVYLSLYRGDRSV
ncbi:MAG: ATP-binding cassette domain-containing protein [Bacillota bacterium]